MAGPAIQISGVSKDFKTDFWKPKVRALEEVTFEVGEGNVCGLVGPNGAGKTTTIKILMGLIGPTSGSVQIFGKPVTDIRFKQNIGYLPENAYYYDFLKTEEVLDFYGRLFGLTAAERRKKTDELLELVGLSERRGIRLRNYSKGMLQRIGIAQALVNDPKLIVLDEPMSGLDPIGRKEVRDIILHLAAQKKTILFSSHILSDVESICEHVAILIRGKLRAHGAIGSLVKRKIKNTEVIFEGEFSGDLPTSLANEIELRRAGHQVIVSFSDFSYLSDVLSWGKGADLKLMSVVPRRESLEDLFLEQVESNR